jgi:hypothetical protein
LRARPNPETGFAYDEGRPAEAESLVETADMSAINALNVARALGMIVRAESDDLMLEAAAAPPAALVDDLKRHKSEIVTILRSADRGPSVEDWLVLFDERAGALEFDGGQPRELAELQAIGSCVLDPVMAETNPEVLYGVVRSLAAHIGRTRLSLVSDEIKDAPGATVDERATP